MTFYVDYIYKCRLCPRRATRSVHAMLCHLIGRHGEVVAHRLRRKVFDYVRLVDEMAVFVEQRTVDATHKRVAAYLRKRRRRGEWA